MADIGVAVLSVTQGVSAFHSFLPTFADIRKGNPQDNPDFAADVRMGEVAAVTTTLGIGAIVASLSKSSAPIYTGLAMCLILVALYETTLRANRPLEPKGNALTEALSNG